MLTKKSIFLAILFTLSMIMVACSSQEYTTAKLAIQQSDFAKAAEWLPKAMAVEPDNPEIPVVLGLEIHAQDGDWKNMVAMFDKAMAIDPDKEIEVRGYFLPVKEQVTMYTDKYFGNEFNEGVKIHQKIEDDPENKSEYLETAILHFNNAALINPFHESSPYGALSDCYLKIGDKEAARNAALIAVEKNPESFQANLKAGQILFRAGASDNLIKRAHIEGLQEGTPEFETFKRLAISEDILPYYEKAASIERSNGKVLQLLAGVYFDLGEKEKSLEVFNNAISNEDDKNTKADLYFNLGVIHSQMKNFEESEKAFDEAFYLNEDDYEAALGMARSYEGLGDNYLNGSEGFEKDLDKSARWYRKAEKKIKSVMIIDIDNKGTYQKTLELIRYKRDVAEGN